MTIHDNTPYNQIRISYCWTNEPLQGVFHFYCSSMLLLDEPLSALDKKLRENMQVELIKLQRQVGITFILVTHDQKLAARCDRTLTLQAGQLISKG